MSGARASWTGGRRDPSPRQEEEVTGPLKPAAFEIGQEPLGKCPDTSPEHRPHGAGRFLPWRVLHTCLRGRLLHEAFLASALQAG